MESKEKTSAASLLTTPPATRVFGIIRAKGSKRILVDLGEVRFEVGIPLEEVRELQRMMFPWYLDLHVLDLGDKLVYKEATPLHRAVVYVLARRGGATVEDARRLALSLLSSELVIVHSFLTRLRWCKAYGHNCKYVLDAFSKIMKTYISIL